MPQAFQTGVEPARPCFAPCASIPDDPWVCIYSKPLQESAIARHLTAEGYAVWSPLVEVRWQNRQTKQSRAFPRYVFAQNYAWMVVRNAGGSELGRVLKSSSGAPLSVPPTAMRALFDQCGPDGVIRSRETSIAVGAKVRIGPLTGICEMCETDRVRVLLSILGRQQAQWFSRHKVEAV